MPASEGWFVVNAAEAAWVGNPDFGWRCSFEANGPALRESPELEQVLLPQLGFRLHVLEPGKPSGLYHAESEQEDFLVLAGECLLVVEEEERRLRAWDFVHCPPGTRHVFVGTDRPCVILMTGARSDEGTILYPLSEAAARHGAAAAAETSSPHEAYAPHPHWQPGRPWSTYWFRLRIAGNFPVLWSEWNGIYRDVVRDFWRGQASVGEFASRFTGSSDLYESDGRQPFASINFITAHDGFTLRDLVTYNEKHNEANLEDNRDGTDDNRSWNCGVEGETDDPEVNALRARQMRNFLATLFLSQGVPMLLGGDEIGRTQGGNNNAWCQDNEISWFEWGLRGPQAELYDFTERLIRLRRDHPVFRRGKFLAGREQEGSGLPDVWWFRPDGRRMTQRDWDQQPRVLGVFLNGQEIADRTPQGEHIEDDSFLLVFNSWHEDVTFTIPTRRFGAEWTHELCTFDPDIEPGIDRFPARGELIVPSRSMKLLRRVA